jgi:uncharacterized membrane protein (GlpM family)
VTPYVFRFLVGGLVVSVFAALGDVLKPKSFAGLFGAAPSIALATLGLTVISDGKSYAAEEARSMIAGAAAFFVYAGTCVHILMKHSLPTAVTTASALALWLIVAVSAWLIFLK